MTTHVRHLKLPCAVVPLLLVLLLVGLAGVPPVAAWQAVSYTGRAFGASVNGSVFSDTGELPPDGTPQSASALNLTVPGTLSVEALVANTSGANGQAQSSAFLLGANVLNGLVTATLLGAESEATCNGVRGSTTIAGLALAGAEVQVTGEVNQTVGPVPVGGLTVTLLINEQQRTSGPGFQEITVNALHVKVGGLVNADVILASARSDIHGCPGCPPAPPCDDFVTGGGWIDGSSQANFGFNAGFRGGSLDAHFNYIDHASGMHMKATSIMEYVATGPTSRRFKGTAEINGVGGHTYTVEVADIGEPGRKVDKISISLSNGYSAAGTLGGGNIQLHKPCP